MKNAQRSSLLFTLFLFMFGTAVCQAAAPESGSGSIGTVNPVRVGIAGTDPFVFSDASAPEGIAVDIWEELASEIEWRYTYQSYSTVASALAAMQNDELDIVVGPISITSARAAKMRFSQPYYQSSISIVSRGDGLGIWSRIEPLFSPKLLIAVGAFAFIMAVVGTLFWLAERKASPGQFPRDPVRGIGNGMWLAIVTMSTTGYGDMAPVTLKGRMIAAVWMVVTIIFATSMVAGIASTLTLAGMSTSTVKIAEELNRRKAATVAGSPAIEFLQEYNAVIVQSDNLVDAMNQLEAAKVDAVVYDRPQLMYFLKETNNSDLYLATAEYDKQGYGFAFPLDSTLVYDVNRVLLKLSEDKKVQAIIEGYLGDENTSGL